MSAAYIFLGRVLDRPHRVLGAISWGVKAQRWKREYALKACNHISGNLLIDYRINLYKCGTSFLGAQYSELMWKEFLVWLKQS